MWWPSPSTRPGLENLHRIGVDEVSYRKGHRYLSLVADHDREGAVVLAFTDLIYLCLSLIHI